MAEIRINTKSSLTVCEGISPEQNQGSNETRLPSLYVRVYRTCSSCVNSLSTSLTVCEGISPDFIL